MHGFAFPLVARFRWKLLPALLLVGTGDWLFYQRHFYGGHFGIFAFALLIAMLAGRPAIMRDRRSWAAMTAAALFALSLLWDASLLAWALFWVAASMTTLIPATGRFDDGWRWLQRLVWQGVRAPFGPLIDMRHLLRVRAAGRTGRWSLHAAATVLTLPLLGSAVILILFAAANPLIEQALSSLLSPRISPELILRAIFWALLLIMVWSLLRPRLALRILPTFDGRGDLPIPGVSIASLTLSLLAFNLIFVAQNLMDVAWLWRLAPMPDGMTLADYAHRGAYPLIATALLAALFVLVALRPGSATARNGSIRRLVMLWIAQNIFLVASAMLRTIDYIEAYSLTRLRIAALAWMALVAFGLAAICWRLLRDRSAAWLINVNLAAAGLVLTVASFVDLGAIAAQWNVRHAREVGGQGAALDLCYLNQMEGSALLPLITLEQRPGLQPDFRERVRAVRFRAYDMLEDGQPQGWSLLGQRRLEQSRQLLAQQKPPIMLPGARACDGSLLPPPPAITAPPPPPQSTTSIDPKAVRALTGEIGK